VMHLSHDVMGHGWVFVRTVPWHFLQFRLRCVAATLSVRYQYGAFFA
jgi:hypothetical protein